MKIETLMEVIQKAAAFALLVGGAWVLMNYVRNRTHRPACRLSSRPSLSRYRIGSPL